MLKILLHNRNQEFISYFQENIDQENVVVLCPNPSKADLIRSSFKIVGIEVESLTIAHFVKRAFEQFEWKIGKTFSLKRKSELLYYLGTAWKKMGIGADINEFKKSFNLLTELRSFSTNEDVLQTALENFNETIASKTAWMHKLIEQLDLLDEHQSYVSLAKILKDYEQVRSYCPEHIIFFGFDFVTGSQIDLIKTLAEYREVSIPFYERAYLEKTHFDWISWVSDSETQLVRLGEEEVRKEKNKTYIYPRNYLGKTIRNVLGEEDYDAVVVSTNQLSFNHVQEIPLGQFSYKFRFEIFEQAYSEISKLLEAVIPYRGCKTDAFLEQINESLQTSIHLKKFRNLKVLLLYKKVTELWRDLSDENEQMILFDFFLIKESVRLDLPRLNVSTLSHQTIGEIVPLNEIEKLREHKVMFLLSSEHKGLEGKSQNYTESVESYLSSVGPIRRSEFDRYILRSKLEEFVGQNQVSFIIERGLLKHNAYLKDLFKEIILEEQQIDSYPISKPVYSIFNLGENKLAALSATKLQSYIDCPRKYFLKYIEKFNPDIHVTNVLTPLTLGRLQHSVIESYFQIGPGLYSQKVHYECISNQLISFFPKDSFEFKKYFIEIYAYTIEVVQFLIKFTQLQKSHTELFFEFPFENKENEIIYSGSIDCFIKLPQGSFIIDFKRSNFSFSSYNSLLEREQIQLWFYVKQLKAKEVLSENVSIGYVDLSEIENSTFISNSDDLLSMLRDTKFNMKMKKVSDWEELLKRYGEFEESLLQKIKEDRSFSPLPKNKMVCQYCLNQYVCSRGELK